MYVEGVVVGDDDDGWGDDAVETAGIERLLGRAGGTVDDDEEEEGGRSWGVGDGDGEKVGEGEGDDLRRREPECLFSCLSCCCCCCWCGCCCCCCWREYAVLATVFDDDVDDDGEGVRDESSPDELDSEPST